MKHILTLKSLDNKRTYSIDIIDMFEYYVNDWLEYGAYPNCSTEQELMTELNITPVYCLSTELPRDHYAYGCVENLQQSDYPPDIMNDDDYIVEFKIEG